MQKSLKGFDLRFRNVADMVEVGDSVEIAITDDGRTRVGKVKTVGDREIELDGSAKLRKSSTKVIFDAGTGFGFEAREVTLL